jgi:hypothetical protein
MSESQVIQDQLYALLARHDVANVVLGLAIIIGRLGFVAESMEIARIGDAIVAKARGNLPSLCGGVC